MTNGADIFMNKCNVLLGGIIALLEYLLGAHWVLFVGFLLLNIADYITGCLKSRLNGKSSSVKGAKGALKKLGYWLMIMVAFGMNVIFEEVGKTIGVNLGVTSLIGWFVLATLIINEIRSIVENFIEAGYNIPQSIAKGLEVANKAIDGTINAQNGDVILHVSDEEIAGKKNLTLKVENGLIVDPNTGKRYDIRDSNSKK